MRLLPIVALVLAGCRSDQPAPLTGFLSDYSRLEPIEDGLRYLPGDGRLGEYDRFLLEPVRLRLHEDAEADAAHAAELAALKAHMTSAIADALRGAYRFTDEPGPGVARVRIALTDVMTSPARQLLPGWRLRDPRSDEPGGASMEAEILDSLTGEQIAALVETQRGEQVPLANLTRWSGARAAMRDWAERFRQRLDEAHGR